MINMQGHLPRNVYLACSGGVDSVAALHFLSRNHKVTVLHVNHNEGNADESENLVANLCFKLDVDMIVKRIERARPTSCSLEEHWRNERYAFFHQFNGTVVTAHTLEDVVETWVWSSLHGCGKLIPYANGNVIRPFMLTQKQQFISWATRNNVSWVEDASNDDMSLTRNYIRKQLMPHILQVNPGIATTIKKKVQQAYV